MNTSLDTPGVTGRFLQLRHASGTLFPTLLLYHKIQISSQNLSYVTYFQGLIFFSFFFSVVLFFVSLHLELPAEHAEWICAHYKSFIIITWLSFYSLDPLKILPYTTGSTFENKNNNDQRLMMCVWNVFEMYLKCIPGRGGGQLTHFYCIISSDELLPTRSLFCLR